MTEYEIVNVMAFAGVMGFLILPALVKRVMKLIRK